MTTSRTATRRTLTVTLTAETHARLLATALRLDERPTELARRALDHYLDVLAATEAHLARVTPPDPEAPR